jgi:hypothetical protein
MPAMSLEVLGTVRPDGTLELDKKLDVSPGRVKVRVEALPAMEAKPADSLVGFVQRLRQEMAAAGSRFMNDEEVTAWVQELRAEDDRLEKAYAQQQDHPQQDRPGC